MSPFGDKETRNHLRKYQAKELNRASTTPSGRGHIKGTLGDYRSAQKWEQEGSPLSSTITTAFARSLARFPGRASSATRRLHVLYVRRAHTRQGRRGEQSGHACFSVRPAHALAFLSPTWLNATSRSIQYSTLVSVSASPEYDDIVFVVVSLHSPCTLSHPLDMHMHTWPSSRSLRLARVELQDERRACAHPRIQVLA